MMTPSPRFAFVCAATDPAILQANFLSSWHALQPERSPCIVRFGVSSAAHAFNDALTGLSDIDWLIWVHQDVRFPPDWLQRFAARLEAALERWPDLAVAGVYGITPEGQRAGRLLDRGQSLDEATPLPALVQSLDELLLAVRTDSGLRMDPQLGFDFYASDLVQQARETGRTAVVLDAWCEHWSTTPLAPPYPAAFLERLGRSAHAFEQKWQHRLPIVTPCLELHRPGSARTQLTALAQAPVSAPAVPAAPGGDASVTALPPDDNLPVHLVLIAESAHTPASDELAFAERQMRSLLPPGVPIVVRPAATLNALIAQAAALLRTHPLHDRHRILLLRSRWLYWSADTLPSLQGALTPDTGMVAAYDSTRPNPHNGPDYLTLRGLQRYGQRIARAQPTLHTLEPAQARAPDFFPALILTTAGALRAGRMLHYARMQPAAHVHDFSGYQQGRREDVLPHVPRNIRSILDVGGGEGRFLADVKAELGCETHLAEYAPAAGAIARSRVDRVWQGDFFTTRFDRSFDCITFLDVLEHSTDPERWLHKARQLLAPGGHILASIPNVGHWSVVADLLEGHWDYAAAGIHCITHLRFFTRSGIEQLMEQGGLRIERIVPTTIAPPDWFQPERLTGTPLALDRDSLSTYAFLVIATARP
ncbi:MAG: class I SAM-dependent methyltransferase [Rhodocyclaceae bacterium]